MALYNGRMGRLRRADWIYLVSVLVAAALSLSLLVGAFLTEGNAANLLIALGATTLIGCMGAAGQLIYRIASRLELSPVNPDPATAGPSGTPNPQPAEAATQSVRLFRSSAASPNPNELVAAASDEVMAMVVSGRNFLQPQLLDTIQEKVGSSTDSCRIRLLALNHLTCEDFLTARSAMMDMRRSGPFEATYRHDFETIREYCAQITVDDPERSSFDVRYYDKLPTSYFYIIDGILYLCGLLSKPIASSPLIIVTPADEESKALISSYRSHFEYYWDSARFFVTLIGLTEDGRTLLVKNRKRGLEWPTGFIEPDEDLAAGAMREFQEESGYSVGQAVPIGQTAHGYFFAARVGERVASPSAREIADVTFVKDLPRKSAMSFAQDHSTFVELLATAREQLQMLPAAPSQA